MLSDIVSALSLSSTSPQCIFASKDLKSDLNFLYCEILSHYVKQDYDVILINFAQSSSHYNHSLIKYGVNLRQLRDRHKITVIDALADFEKVCSGEVTNDSFWLSAFSVPGPCRLKELYLTARKSVDQFRKTDESRPFVIFIDEITVLLNLGVSLSSIEPFIQYCIGLTKAVPEKPNVLFMGTVRDNIDCEATKLDNYFSYICDIKIEVEGLKTGYSKDADGKISLYIRKKEGESEQKKLLFKVSEKGAKLLTLGL